MLYLIALVVQDQNHGNYTVNQLPEEKNELGVPDGYAAFDYGFVGLDTEVSFLYPESGYVSYSPDRSLYIYSSEEMNMPYITIYSAEIKAVSPDAYFDCYKTRLASRYSDAKMSKIKKVQAEDKTVYMTSASVKDDEGTLTIERYLEIYPEMNIQYTLKTHDPEQDESVLYSIISSLKPYEYAYEYPDYMKDILNGSSTDNSDETEDPAKESNQEDEIETVTNDSMGISMSLPVSVNGKSIAVGVYGSSENYTFLASYMNTDPDGAMIYSKDDFMIRCPEDINLLARQLGADQAAASNGSTVKLNGQNAFQLDVEEVTGSYHGKGKLYVLNGDNIGIYLVHYTVSTDASDQKNLTSLADQCIADFDHSAGVQGLRTFEQMTYEKLHAVFVLEKGALKYGTQDTGSGLALYVSSDDTNGPITVEGKSAETVGTSDPSEYIRQTYAQFQSSRYYTPSMTDITACGLGRYGAVTADITYHFNDTDYTCRVTAFKDSGGLMWMIRYTVPTAMLSEYETIGNDIV